MTAPRSSVLLAAALGAVLAAYSNGLAGPFVWDDRVLLLDNPLTQRLSPAAHFLQPFWRVNASDAADGAYYRPATTFSFAIDQARGGGKPGSFHATNIALHLACCALVFALARLAGATPIGAALGAALFGLFPRLTESVSWISGRTDVLATCLALLALALHASAPERLGRRCAAAIALFLALLAKEVAMAALAGLVALEMVRAARDGASPLRGLRALWPAFAATALYLAARTLATRGLPVGGNEPVGVLARCLQPPQVLGQYVLMALDPLRPRLRIGLYGDVRPGLAALGVAAAIASGVGARRLLARRPEPVIAAALASAAAALGLVLQFLPLRLGTLTTDRFLYLPAAGLAIALAGAAARLGKRSARVALVSALVALPAFGFATAMRNEDWVDEARLWRAAADAADPRDPLPWNELANALSHANRFEEALRVYRQVADRTTGTWRIGALGNVAGALSDLGRYAEARDLLEELVRADPGRPLHMYNLGLAEMRLLRFDQADADLARALEIWPQYEQARQARQILASARAAWSALPTPSPDEPASVKARRAEVWCRLGAPASAQPLWRDVASSRDATGGDLTQAAAFLASRGSEGEARAAAARARAAGGPADKLRDIEAVIEAHQAP